MFAVNNSKNPVRGAKSSAKYSKLGEEAGSCCNHGKNPGEVEGGWGAHVCLRWLRRAGITTASSFRNLRIKKPAGNTLRLIVQSTTLQ